MQASPEDQEEFNANKRTFGDFLNGDARQKYSSRLQDVLDEKTNRFMVNLDDMRAFDHELTQRLLREPSQFLPPFEERLQEEAEDLSPGSTDPDRPIRIGIEGSFGRHRVSPRSLLSPLLGTLVCVEGIATKISVVHPKVKRTTHYCPTTNKMMSREYRDETSLTGLPTGSAYPKKDDEGNLLETEFGLSTYTDHQTLSIQEMPEHAPHGQLPCSVDVILNDDLVDQCKPGDRVRIVGIFRGISRQSSGAASGVFKTVLVANHVSQLKRTTTGPDAAEAISEEDEEAIRALSQRDDIFEILSRSIAPSVFGHEYIKKAVLMQLLGGVEKNLKNGTHLRGDINILMVGDPSTAKSQMLRYVMNTAQLAISTTGRGSSGVGLTAAVTSDPETKERRLEAGAMVLADRGVVCIDEFDKMSELDRVAIHEVMEQQTVTIAKAGIHCSLNARCSVIAAANPVCGQYDRDSTPQRNIGMPDSLLSRFDLLFIVLDDLDDEHNSKIANHVLRLHRYQIPGQEGEPVPVGGRRGLDGSLGDEEDEEEEEENSSSDKAKRTPVFEKFNPLLHGGVLDMVKKKNNSSTQGMKCPEILSHKFLRLYIEYAKHKMQPKLTKEASDMITETYPMLRQRVGKNTIPITARQLETMIRLSSSHAKARLSDKVEKVDVEVARKVLCYALFPYNDGEMPEIGGEEEEFVISDGEQDGGFVEPTKTSGKRKRDEDKEEKIDDSDFDEDLMDFESSPKQMRMDDGEETKQVQQEQGVDQQGGFDEKEMLQEFRAFIVKSRPREETALSARGMVNDFMEEIKISKSLYNTARVKLHGYLQRLHDDNNIMLDGDEVYFI